MKNLKQFKKKRLNKMTLIKGGSDQGYDRRDVSIILNDKADNEVEKKH